MRTCAVCTKFALPMSECPHPGREEKVDTGLTRRPIKFAVDDGTRRFVDKAVRPNKHLHDFYGSCDECFGAVLNLNDHNPAE